MDRFPELLKYTQKFEDERGNLEVLYESSNMVLKRSFSKKGVFRGLHVQQAPYQQTKLIRVVTGKIIDFLVDIDASKDEVFYQEITAKSEWVKIESNYAHGFYACEDTIFEYICDGPYNEEAERAFSIMDFLTKKMNLDNLVLSKKDLSAEPLK